MAPETLFIDDELFKGHTTECGRRHNSGLHRLPNAEDRSLTSPVDEQDEASDESAVVSKEEVNCSLTMVVGKKKVPGWAEGWHSENVPWAPQCRSSQPLWLPGLGLRARQKGWWANNHILQSTACSQPQNKAANFFRFNESEVGAWRGEAFH
ncbi:hypothetical protein C0Q70_05107 [Pomacea canaliculata]|uniref:Uncharacterized protein n=1 Tax=Pomacea canaliculata TaxID=400727 RepID=A0A2T7PK81_POMCA|nr:hypothetical protein C0Q70_05107 [Pomacea canaliculata]